MSDKPIKQGIEDFTKEIRSFSHSSLWDIDRPPSEEDEKDRKAKVLALCDELDAFANNADTGESTFRDFERFRHKLAELGATGTDSHVVAVANAFNAGCGMDTEK